jgi:MOSC domain-containing protein YiiM
MSVGPAPERVLSVNVGRAAPVPYRGNLVATGIDKSPAAGRVRLLRLGFEGDEQADVSVHGGPDKAAYVYSADSYAWWAEELGGRLPPGQFGENLTVSGLLDADVRAGDTFRVGEALVAATGPREPCFKLGIRMGSQAFVRRFLMADRMGFYLRVLEEGTVAAGDAVERLASDPKAPAIAEIHRLYAHARDDLAGLRSVAEAPAVSDVWRGWARKQVARVEDGADRAWA